MKSGIKTTEFWMSVIPALVGLLTALGIISPEQGSGITEGVTQIIGGIITIAAAFGYAVSRGIAKMNQPPASGSNVLVGATKNERGFTYLPIITLIVLCFLAVPLTGCLNKFLGAEKNTPKARGLLAMKTYNSVRVDYETWVQYTDLKADEVDALNQRRILLINAYKPMNYYNEYVETGKLPTDAMERALITYLRKLQRDAIRGAKSRPIGKTKQQALDELKEAGLVSRDAELPDESINTTMAISPSIISLLIELAIEGIHSAAVIFEMRSMTVEEIDGQWMVEWEYFKGWDPGTLPVPQIGA